MPRVIGSITLNFVAPHDNPPPLDGSEILIWYGRNNPSMYFVMWNGDEWTDGSARNFDPDLIQSWAAIEMA